MNGQEQILIREKKWLELRQKLASEFAGQLEHALGLVQLRLEWTSYLLEEGQPAEADNHL